MTDGWLGLASRALHDAEILMWNKIAMMWLEPFLLAAIFAGVGYAAYRFIKHMD